MPFETIIMVIISSPMLEESKITDECHIPLEPYELLNHRKLEDIMVQNDIYGLFNHHDDNHMAYPLLESRKN